MKQTILYLTFSILFLSCNAQNQHDLAIPDKVAVDKGKAITKFPGTNTFLNKPDGYNLIKNLLRFQKSEGTYIQLMQFPVTSNFETKRKEIDNYFQNAVASGKLQKEYYKKNFKLGEYDALLYYGKDDAKPGFEQMVLLFGDNTFVNMALGEIPANQPTVRNEVLSGLLSLYVDKSVPVNPTELTTFTLSTDNTEFKFFGSASQMFYYTLGGKGDPMQNPYESQIMLMTLPAMQKEQIKNYAISMIGNYKNSGMTIPSYSGKDTSINGNYAYQITYEGSFKGKKNYVYQIVTGNQNSSLLYLGGLYDRPEQLMPQVKKILNTLRLK